jgi:RimJ/RimL family protein N-acetyltransferase
MSTHLTQPNRSSAMTTPGMTYELRVEGHLDHHWSEVLASLAITHLPDGTSTLSGPIADQAQLHGVLTGLQNIGATLLALHALDCTQPASRRASSADVPPAQRALATLDWPRSTSRLRLRPARPSDAEPTWAFRRLEEVGRWLTEIPADLETYRHTFTEPARLATTLIIEHDGKVIGDLMLRVEDTWAQAEVADQAASTQAELGWVLDPAHTGAGYATEAVNELLHICFADLGLRRVTAECFTDNEASWRLMERLGMRRELHAVNDALHRSSTWHDTFGYGLLATEWHPV